MAVYAFVYIIQLTCSLIVHSNLTYCRVYHIDQSEPYFTAHRHEKNASDYINYQDRVGAEWKIFCHCCKLTLRLLLHEIARLQPYKPRYLTLQNTRLTASYLHANTHIHIAMNTYTPSHTHTHTRTPRHTVCIIVHECIQATCIIVCKGSYVT